MKRRLVLLIICGHMCLTACGGQIFDQAAQNKIGKEENDNKTKSVSDNCKGIKTGIVNVETLPSRAGTCAISTTTPPLLPHR